MSKKKNMIRVASFDIGKKNFAFLVEEFDSNELLRIKNIPESKRYNPNGTATEDFQEVMDQVFSNGHIVLHQNLDLTENCDSKKTLDPETYHNMIEALDQYDEYWESCSVILIEEQMSFGKKINKMAMKLAQHCYSYFTIKYPRQHTIVEFPAYHKTQVLGAPKVEGKPYKSGKIRYKAMEPRDRKKWSVNKAIEILTGRAEIEILDEMTSVRKKDDLADVLVQLQSFKYKMYVDKSM
jgi:hypothetical protein